MEFRSRNTTLSPFVWFIANAPLELWGKFGVYIHPQNVLWWASICKAICNRVKDAQVVHVYNEDRGRLHALNYFANITHLDIRSFISGSRIDLCKVPCISTCLTRLDLVRDVTWSTGTETPQRCHLFKPELRTLYVDAIFSPNGLKMVAFNLQYLTALTELRVVDMGLEFWYTFFWKALSRLTTLETLNLSHNPVLDSGCIELSNCKLPKLTNLTLNYNVISSAGLLHILHEYTNLTTLSLSECSIASLQGCKFQSTLKHLNLAWNGLKLAALRTLCNELPRHGLVSLNLSYNLLSTNSLTEIEGLRLPSTLTKLDLERNGNFGSLAGRHLVGKECGIKY